jgi:uncharacterized Tic20 family protein
MDDAAVLGMGWVLQLDGSYSIFIFICLFFWVLCSMGLLKSYAGSQFVIVLGMRVLKSAGVSLAQLLSFVFNEDEGFEEG